MFQDGQGAGRWAECMLKIAGDGDDCREIGRGTVGVTGQDVRRSHIFGYTITGSDRFACGRARVLLRLDAASVISYCTMSNGC